MSEPFVTCLCITRKRQEFLPRAIECYLAQTWRQKLLLILGDDPSDYEGLIPNGHSFEDPSCDHCIIFSSSCSTTPLFPWSISAKRNFGCDVAQESRYVAIWDDDDLSKPRRLQYQVSELERTGKSVHGFSAVKFTDGKNWWKFPKRPREGFPIDASLVFRLDFWREHPFRGGIGCESRFSTEARRAGQLIESPDMDLMYCSIHPGNTTKRRPNESYARSAPPVA